ncbi:MAG: amidohydrolase [Deltaproteobacteria bacterium]|nr:amidohydrolase [Deltaproteobacteria bacterium]MBW1949331.1 amidohydrolase [Deltaproteobacteria bacterium]MBW2008874.1 amidohydrolase [Deltaproteobacteria bacterium]
MRTYEVIDAHVHTYKTPEIGRQALSGFHISGCCGTPEELTGILEEAGVTLAVQCNMTPARSMLEAALSGMPEEPSPAEKEALTRKISDRIRRRNRWTCETAGTHARLVPFISLDPIMGRDAMTDEMVQCIEQHGARGLKIHPGEGHFMPDDTSLHPVYEILERRGLPVISHGGLDLANPDPSFTRPEAFAPLLARFPRLTLVIAHLGRDFFEESVRLAKEFPNVFFDTSAVIPGNETGDPLEGLSSFTDREAVAFIRKIGVDRVLFGSDYPWFHPGWDLRRFLRLPFTEEEKAALLGANARRILGL